MNNLSFWVSGLVTVTKVIPNHPASSGWDQAYSWKLQTCSLPGSQRQAVSLREEGLVPPASLPAPTLTSHHMVTPPWAEWPEEKAGRVPAILPWRQSKNNSLTAKF